MSGIFRYSSTANSTPVKRTTLSPFCTSPGQLQDVTMDNSYAMGYRSPCVSLQPNAGNTSPGQGRTVREFEEQMAALRKENFNLKLRLYFTEEKLPGFSQMNTPEGQESLMKQYVDAKVENEVLQKEIKEKQDLIIDAAQALTQMEKLQKDTEQRSNEVMEELNQKIQYLEAENKELEKSNNGPFMDQLMGRSEISSDFTAIQRVRELEGTVKQFDDRIIELMSQLESIKTDNSLKDNTIKDLEVRVKELVFQNAELLEHLECKETEVASVERNCAISEKEAFSLKIENNNLQNDIKFLQEQFDHEKNMNKNFNEKVRLQKKWIDDIQASIISEQRKSQKLLIRTQEYEKDIYRLRHEKRKMQKERFHSDNYFNSSGHNGQNQIIRLSTSDDLFLNDILSNKSGQYLPNSLFLSRPLQVNNMAGDCNHVPQYKLKEKVSIHLNNRRKMENISPEPTSSQKLKQINNEFIDEIRKSFSDTSVVTSCSNSSMAPNFSPSDMFDFNCNTDSQINSSESLTKPQKPIKSQRLREELLDYKRKLADNICVLEEAEEKLKEKTVAHEKTCNAVQKLMLNIKTLQDEVERLKRHNASTSYVKEMSNESTALCRSLSDTDGFAESSSLRTKYEHIIERKDGEIAKLQIEVKKKTSNLQNLVNRELWEKNREIERLMKIMNKSATQLSSSALNDSDKLQKSFTDVDYMEALEHNKSLQKKVDILIHRLSATKSLKDDDTIIQQLKQEIKEAKMEADQSEKWRRECMELCSVLTSRLEELAGFLDSLLKHKEVLGALGADRRRAMRKAVDKSFDLSKSLNNMTMSMSGLSMTEHSLAQLTNLSGILDFSVNKENKTFNSHEDVRHDCKVIENLQAEVMALKKELDKRRSSDITKKDRRSVSVGIANQSESEAWSEPDRKVSLARIGLEEPRKSHSVKNDTDSEDSLNLSNTKSKTQEKISHLEQLISQRDNRILEVQCELVDVDNRLKQENLRVIEMTSQLEDYKEINELLQIELTKMKQQTNSDETKLELGYLKKEFEEKLNFIQKLQEERDKIHVEARVYEIQIEKLRAEIEELKNNNEICLQNAALQEKDKLENLQNQFQTKMDSELKKLEDIHKQILSRDWIARELYEDYKKQMEIKLNEAQNTIEFQTENEEEMKSHLIENEKHMRAVKKQLDDATLQASKTVLERTKALNDKLQLETKVEELEQQMHDLKMDKQELFMKMSQLETANSNLQDKVVNTKPANIGSDVSNSGYTSEEVLLRSGCIGGRRLENSSPDLGIESDGRVSSVELASAQKHMLKLVEIGASPLSQESKEELKSILNDFSEDAKPILPSNKPSSNTHVEHDCAKVDQENAELRRKLIRSKRSFEETINKLRIDNQRKEQVERDIKNQILKTNNVLRNVRSNIENELK